MAAAAKRIIKKMFGPLTRSNSALGQSGFTLIEAMLIGAMLAVTVVTFSSMHVQRLRLIKKVQEQKQVQGTQNGIINAASQAGAITASEELMYDDTKPLMNP